MAFSEIELKYIQKIVGRICARRSPPHLHEAIRTIYEISNHDVIIIEERPRFDTAGEWTRMPCAKFKYDRTTKRWKLYWMRQDRKWHSYKTDTMSHELEALVSVVDRDPDGAFFG